MKHSIESDLFRLGHIVDCTERIAFLVNSCKTVVVFKSKWVEQDAMLRNFEIIGEASNHISNETKQKYPTIEWFKIRGMRNFVSHEYFSMRLETIWETAVTNIPILKTQIAQIISDLETI
jgi:uncharacterized protein with HEPN domain